MQCPVDGTALAMSDRQGVEIDYCPKCRGVWLDRGELDKLIERSAGYEAARGAAPASQSQSQDYDRHNDRRGDYQRYDKDEYHGKHHKKKKESFLGDLFDF